ncbi:metallophosphoesterase [Verrucomicrobiaceae bacterium R5-34]|nr:metallophosphoesterase [Verrucomicrobiaceae bacterium R5-34]
MSEKKGSVFNRRNFIRASVLGSIGAYSYARWVEPGWLTITEKDIVLPKLPPALDGLVIAQLTDFHFQPDRDESLIADAVAAVNAHQPDLIALTGDFITESSKVFSPLMQVLSGLEAKHGIYGVMGNHDGWSQRPGFYRQGFQEVGMEFLTNRGTRIELHGESLFITGTDSVWSGKVDAAACWKGHRDEPVLALVHEPDVFDHLRPNHRIDLQLSGHTHGGQCRVPLIGYAPVKVRYGRNYIYGEYARDDSKIFVSRGLGTVGQRVRFACAPEVAILTLRSA